MFSEVLKVLRKEKSYSAKH